MSAADFGVIVGMVFAAFGSGWVTGTLFKAVRRVFESAVGPGG